MGKSLPYYRPLSPEDVKKMKTLLDWEPKTAISEGIRKTVAWYVENEIQKAEGGDEPGN